LGTSYSDQRKGNETKMCGKTKGSPCGAVKKGFKVENFFTQVVVEKGVKD